MTDLTDPKLAQLGARYRAWVETENEEYYAWRPQDHLTDEVGKPFLIIPTPPRLP